MGTKYYNSKIDWWVPCVVVFTVIVCFIGPLIDGDSYHWGLMLALGLLIVEVVMFASVKYQIRDGKLGIRNWLYKWEWFPIDKISEVKKTRSVLSSAALSFDRIAVRFSDKKILKSSMPLEISPKDRDGFMAQLKEINPNIAIING